MPGTTSKHGFLVHLAWRVIRWLQNVMAFLLPDNLTRKCSRIYRGLRLDVRPTLGSHSSLCDDSTRILLEKVLHSFDLDGSGHISRGELRNALRTLGHNPGEEEVNLLLAQIDKDGNGVVDNEELLDFMSTQVTLDDPDSDLGAVFRMLDPQGRGFVPGSVIRRMLRGHGCQNDQELLALFDDDWDYSLREFLSVVTCGEY